MATRPIVRITQRLPVNQRDWEEFLRDLNGTIQMNGDQAVLGALTTISERTGTNLATLASYLTDDGKAEDQRFLPQVSAGNVMSKQSVGPVTNDTSIFIAAIAIAAHTVQYGFGQVSYNSGYISGLLFDTDYYIYAEDPDYAGGAVTYLASTNPMSVTASNGRYFAGAVRTTVAQAIADVIAATSANPIAIQTDGDHGWSTGFSVRFDGMPGAFGVLDGNTYSIVVTGADAFTIDVNGSGFAAYTSGGEVVLIGATALSGNGGGGGWVEGSFNGIYG